MSQNLVNHASPTTLLGTAHTPTWVTQPLTLLETMLYYKIVCLLTVIERSAHEIEQIYDSGRRVRELGPQHGSFISREPCDCRESLEATPITVKGTK